MGYINDEGVKKLKKKVGDIYGLLAHDVYIFFWIFDSPLLDTVFFFAFYPSHLKVF